MVREADPGRALTGDIMIFFLPRDFCIPRRCIVPVVVQYPRYNIGHPTSGTVTSFHTWNEFCIGSSMLIHTSQCFRLPQNDEIHTICIPNKELVNHTTKLSSPGDISPNYSAQQLAQGSQRSTILGWIDYNPNEP